MANKQKNRIREKLYVLVIIAVFIVAMLSSSISKVSAGAITQIWSVETNMDATGSGQLWVAFKTTGAVSTPTTTFALGGGGAGVQSTNANLAPVTSISSTSCTSIFNMVAGVLVMPGTLNATGSGATITLTTTGNFAATTAYCVIFSGVAAVTNPTSAGVYSFAVSDTTDSGSTYYPVLAVATNEQIGVSAQVGQSFTLTLGGTTDTLGTLSTGGVISSAGVTATVTTNAAGGPVLFAYDTQGGLHSTNAGHTIASKNPNNTSAQTITSAAEGYVANAVYNSDTGGDTMSIATPFTGTGGTGDGLSPYPAELAYATATAGPTNLAIITIKENATITGLTPEASDYSDAVYIVGTGTF
jgi:hypothetical protein